LAAGSTGFCFAVHLAGWFAKSVFMGHHCHTAFDSGNGLEVVLKPQIRFKGKAQADRESAAYMGM
jgi:hypothetical protein